MTYYYQECPACARTLSIAVAHLGKSVSCRHCGRRFVAEDPAAPPSGDWSSSDVLERADRLLRQVEDELSTAARSRYVD